VLGAWNTRSGAERGVDITFDFSEVGNTTQDRWLQTFDFSEVGKMLGNQRIPGVMSWTSERSKVCSHRSCVVFPTSEKSKVMSTPRSAPERVFQAPDTVN
jgi:hypothetical protein